MPVVFLLIVDKSCHLDNRKKKVCGIKTSKGDRALVLLAALAFILFCYFACLVTLKVRHSDHLPQPMALHARTFHTYVLALSSRVVVTLSDVILARLNATGPVLLV